MNYAFPKIDRIDDVVGHIDDSFVVADKGDYTVIDYAVSGPDTFPVVDETNPIPAAVRRECRGLIFNADGQLIRRPLHKFFNVNERAETQLDSIDWSKPHVILEKLDGSMIAPFLINGELHWGTKMGDTEVSALVYDFVSEYPEYEQLAMYCIQFGLTPIFEWCTRKNRIVIDYETDSLVLTAVRSNADGGYIPYESMVTMASDFGVDVVQVLDAGKLTPKQLVERIAEMEDREGVVVRFGDGHMIKIKTEWYVKIHRAKDAISNERMVVQMILDGGLDDLKAFLPELDLKRLEQFERDFLFEVSEAVCEIKDWIDGHQWNFDGDKKQFAINAAPGLFPIPRSLIFACWDDPTHACIREQLIKTLRKHLTKNVRYDEFKKHFFTNISYQGTFTNDDV